MNKFLCKIKFNQAEIKISSRGIFHLVCNNSEIRNICLNGCNNLDEQALYNIARGLGQNLCILELDHLHVCER